MKRPKKGLVLCGGLWVVLMIAQLAPSITAGHAASQDSKVAPISVQGSHNAYDSETSSDSNLSGPKQEFDSSHGSSGYSVQALDTPTATATDTPTNTPVAPTATATDTPTNTPIVPTATATDTPTNTPVAPTATATDTPTNTPIVPTATATNTPTDTPVAPTATPTDTPTNTPVGPSVTPTNTPTNTPVPPTYTPTPTPTSTPTPTPIIFEGCTPDYWKRPQNFDAWKPTGYSPKQMLAKIFKLPNPLNQEGATLQAALNFKGGSNDIGAAQVLARAAVAALLNASHPDITYPRSPAQVILATNAAFATRNRTTMLNLALSLSADNSKGCPLS